MVLMATLRWRGALLAAEEKAEEEPEDGGRCAPGGQLPPNEGRSSHGIRAPGECTKSTRQQRPLTTTCK